MSDQLTKEPVKGDAEKNFLSRVHEIASCGNDMLSHGNEMLPYAHEMLSREHTHTQPFNRPFFRDYPGEPVPKRLLTNPDFTEARDSEWQQYQLGRMQVCTLLQTDNHTSTPPLSFLQAGCPSCRPTDSVKALKDN